MGGREGRGCSLQHLVFFCRVAAEFSALERTCVQRVYAADRLLINIAAEPTVGVTPFEVRSTRGVWEGGGHQALLHLLPLPPSALETLGGRWLSQMVSAMASGQQHIIEVAEKLFDAALCWGKVSQAGARLRLRLRLHRPLPCPAATETVCAPSRSVPRAACSRS